MVNKKSLDDGLTKTEITTANLRQDIITCLFAPGIKLTFEKLIKRYDVSISTLRESLTTLVVEGLVRSLPRRGFWVSEVSSGDLDDLTQMRIALEIEALKRSIVRGQDEWEGKIIQALHFLNRDDNPTTVAEKYDNQQYHSNLHHALYSACGSPRIIELCAALDFQSNRYRHIFYEAMYTSKQHWINHSKIVEAALSRKSDTACELLEQHIHKTAHFLMHEVSEDEWKIRLSSLNMNTL